MKFKDDEGNVFWYNEHGQLHREGDLPACEWADGTKVWYVNGKPNREGGLPACEWADGTKFWYVNGKPNREGGLPAVEWAESSGMSMS